MRKANLWQRIAALLLVVCGCLAGIPLPVAVALSNTALAPAAQTAPSQNLSVAPLKNSTPPQNFAKNFAAPQTNLPGSQAVITEENLDKWLREFGLALVKSFAVREFPDVKPERIATFQIGKAKKVYTLREQKDHTGTPSIVESPLRLAPISDVQGNAVGVIKIELNTEATTQREVFADAKLAQYLLPPPANTQAHLDPQLLVYDAALKAWFAIKEEMVEAASASAENIILGNVPVEVFFTQRAIILQEKQTAATIEKAPAEQPRSTVQHYLDGRLIVFCCIAALLAFSLVWLSWEARFAQRPKQHPERLARSAQLGALPKSARQRIVPKRRIRFRGSEKAVTVYENENKNLQDSEK